MTCMMRRRGSELYDDYHDDEGTVGWEESWMVRRSELDGEEERTRWMVWRREDLDVVEEVKEHLGG